MRNRLADRATRRVGTSTRISSHRRHPRANPARRGGVMAAPIRVHCAGHGTPRRRLVLVLDGQPRPGAAAARRAGAGRRRRHRRGLHRAVVRDPAARDRAHAARRRARGRPGRLGRERPQRRVLRGVADPRPPQRDPPLPGRARGPRGARARATSRELVAFVRNEGIDAELEETGTLDVATEPWQVDGLHEYVDLAARYGETLTFLDREAIQAEVHSPRFLAGVRVGPERCVMVNPAKLAWGLATAAERRGAPDRGGLTGPPARATGGRASTSTSRAAASSRRTTCSSGRPRTARWMRRLASTFVPVYDYVLMTEPLTAGQRDAIGWAGREGMSDAGNQFHYFRQSADDRILWGGYDAIYHPGNAVKPAYDRAAGDVRRRWRATSSRPSPSSTGSGSPTAGAARSTPRRGSASRSGTPSAGGSTTRWATRASASARHAGRPASCATRPPPGLDLLRLRFVRSRPFPIPPEPARTPAVELMRRVGHRRRLERGPARAVPPGDGRAGDRLRLVGPVRSRRRGWRSPAP